MLRPVLGTAVRCVLVALSCAAVGTALVAGASPAISVAVAIVLLMLLALFYGGQTMRGLLCLTFFTAPLDLGKALITPVSAFVPDAPGLSISAMDLPAFAFAALWLWRRLMVERRPIDWSRTDVVAGAFLAWIWLEALRSPASGALGIATAMAYSKFVLLFFVISHAVRTSKDWHAVMVGCAAIFFLQSLQVVAQMLTQSPLALPGSKLPDTASVVSFGGEGSAFRPMGFFNHPNALAYYLVLLLPAPLCFAMLGPRRIPSRVWFGSLAMLLVGGGLLALTLSRGGWISFAVAVFVGAAVFWRAGAISSRQVQVGALLTSLAVTAVLASTPRLLLRLTEPDSRSLESRSLLAGQAMTMLGEHPWLGVGFGGYYRASRDYAAPGFAKVSPEYQQSIRQLVVHNHYLLLAVELGTPAMIVFVLFLLSLIGSIRPVKRWHDPGRFALAVGLASALAGNLLFLASDNYYADIRVAMLWLVAGLLQAAVLERSEAAKAALPLRSEATRPRGLGGRPAQGLVR